MTDRITHAARSRWERGQTRISGRYVHLRWDELKPDVRDALVEARKLAQEHRVPVVVEVILEKVTNIAMGLEIDKIVEFEEIECRHPQGLQGLELAGLLD